MCGICGIISLNGRPLNDSTKVVETMNKAIYHRGPDGSGIHFGGNYCFGHTRLSIVDLSIAGKQPMIYDNRYIITYNGEIYNHIEIRMELEKVGYIFQSKTDTEVIMASYDYWGVDCVKKFNGMWAFIIYDKKETKYFISRDRFGIKPLYYYKTDELFIFCSEIKALLAHPDINAKPNIDYLRDYIKYGPNEYDEITAFHNIFRFPFAHSFEGQKESLSRGFKPMRYWDIEPNLSNETFSKSKANEYANRYYELLADAVRIRLRADVNIGSALSGGLDSSSIVYLVNQELSKQGKKELQHTFSTVYKSKSVNYCDESSYIDILAEKLNVRSWQIEPDIQNVISEHRKMIIALENPPNSSLMSSWHTFWEVNRRDVKVTLDGQGADEQLGGYIHYIKGHLLSLKTFEFLKEFFFFLKQPNLKKELLKVLILRLLLSLFGKKILSRIFINIRGLDVSLCLNKTLKSSFETTLVTLLHYADHTSMAHGIESRMPFMDFRLVEFLSSVPSCYKIHRGWTKYLARLAFDGKLPDEVVWRRDKMGWPVPDDVWFRNKLRSEVDAHLNNSKLLSKICDPIKNNETTASLLRKYNICIYEKVFFSKYT